MYRNFKKFNNNIFYLFKFQFIIFKLKYLLLVCPQSSKFNKKIKRNRNSNLII